MLAVSLLGNFSKPYNIPVSYILLIKHAHAQNMFSLEQIAHKDEINLVFSLKLGSLCGYIAINHSV